jgi:hypothetical protein
MWLRNSFENCGKELAQLSEQFRELYLMCESDREPEHDDALIEVSVKGRDLLDILALTIRRELDDRNIKLNVVVGCIKEKSSEDEQVTLLENYQPSKSTSGFKNLTLRGACNKIAHTRIQRAGFFADENTHHQLLCGNYNGNHWIAVVDIIAFSQILQSLPQIERPNTFGVFPK